MLVARWPNRTHLVSTRRNFREPASSQEWSTPCQNEHTKKKWKVFRLRHDDRGGSRSRSLISQQQLFKIKLVNFFKVPEWSRSRLQLETVVSLVDVISVLLVFSVVVLLRPLIFRNWNEYARDSLKALAWNLRFCISFCRRSDLSLHFITVYLSAVCSLLIFDWQLYSASNFLFFWSIHNAKTLFYLPKTIAICCFLCL